MKVYLHKVYKILNILQYWPNSIINTLDDGDKIYWYTPGQNMVNHYGTKK